MKTYYHHDDDGFSGYEYVYAVDVDNKQVISYYVDNREPGNVTKVFDLDYMYAIHKMNKRISSYTKLTEEQFNEWLFIHGL